MKSKEIEDMEIVESIQSQIIPIIEKFKDRKDLIYDALQWIIDGLDKS